jgi:hypothetical protein
MQWDFVILSDRNLINVRAWGKFSAASFEGMINDIQSHEQWRTNMDRLFDFSGMDLTETTPDDISACAKIHMKYNSRIGHGRIAVVFRKEAAFGLGRLYETCLGSDVLATVKSFHTADEARHWLAEGASHIG